MKKAGIALALTLCVALPLHAAKGGMGAIFGSLIGGGVGLIAGKSMANTQSIDGALVKMADQVNKRLPMNVDKDTRWDNVTPLPDRRFTYNYTFLGRTSKDYDKQELFQRITNHVKPQVCSSPDMEIFLKNGVSIGYSYRGFDGVFITKVVITPKDCGYVT